MLILDPSYRATLNFVVEYPWLASYSDLLGRSVEENERIAKEMQLPKHTMDGSRSGDLGWQLETYHGPEQDYGLSRARLSTDSVSTTQGSLVEESSQAEAVDSEILTKVSLEELMSQTNVKDLTGQVHIPDYRRPIHGGFAMVFTGLWNNKKVCVSGNYCMIHNERLIQVAVKLLKATKNLRKPAPWEASMERVSVLLYVTTA